MADTNPIDALVPTAQNSADSRPHGNRAMTAPGSDPADGVAEQPVPAPQIVPEHFAPSTHVDGGEGDEGAAWERVSGQEWRP